MEWNYLSRFCLGMGFGIEGVDGIRDISPGKVVILG